MIVHFLAAAAAAPAAHAPPPVVSVQTPKVDSAALAEAIRLLDADGFEESLMRSTDLMVGLTLSGMVENLHKEFGDDVPDDFVEQLRTLIRDHAMTTMRTHMTDLKRQAAEIYAEQFTVPELVHLRELHADPVAVKARERSKVMQPRMAKIGVDVMRDANPALEADIKRLISDYAAHHGKTSSPSS